MHAVVGKVSVQSGREDEAVENLKAEVLPRVKQAPGLVGGYWLAPQDGQGMGITFFESEEAAQAAMEMAQKNPTPDYVSWDSIDVREVIAQI
jgi:heme-degrading monooxygenase HmoA